jgi:hypothetical protein
MKRDPKLPDPDYNAIVPELRPPSMAVNTVRTWCQGWYAFWKGEGISRCTYRDEQYIHIWRRGWRAAESVKGSQVVHG